MQLNHQARTKILAGVIAGAMILSFSAPALAEDAVAVKVDAEAAQKLARKDSCLRCHDVSKGKEGPSYQSIAKKYRGNSEAADKLVKHITSGEDKVRLSDGHEELHRFDKKHDMDKIRNLVNWILAQ